MLVLHGQHRVCDMLQWHGSAQSLAVRSAAVVHTVTAVLSTTASIT